MIDPLPEIKKLTQVGSLQSYLDEFDALLSKVDLTESQAVSHFLGGLKHEVELSVRLFRTATLQDAYRLARVQDLLWNSKHPTQNTYTTKPHSYSKPSYTTTPATIKTVANPH